MSERELQAKIRKICERIKVLVSGPGISTYNVESQAKKITRACRSYRMDAALEPINKLTWEQKKAAFLSADLSPQMRAKREELWPLIENRERNKLKAKTR